jgi:ATP-dependent Clp protease ATP-binding subunit ClpB
LFDEIEKAHPEIFNIFLQILDEGRLVDSKGKFSDFKNTIIILTSNLGSSFLLNGEKDKAFELVKKKLRPEFLNRLDEIIVFNNLTEKNLQQIIRKELFEFKARLQEKKIYIDFSSNITSYLLLNGYNSEYGARPLKRLIEKKIGTFIADEIIKNNIKNECKIFLDINKDLLHYKFID